jgi:hypothetical protein
MTLKVVTFGGTESYEAAFPTLSIDGIDALGLSLEADGTVTPANLSAMVSWLAGLTPGDPFYLNIEPGYTADVTQPTRTSNLLATFKSITTAIRAATPEKFGHYMWPMHRTWYTALQGVGGPSYAAWLADQMLHNKQLVDGSWVDDPNPWHRDVDYAVVSLPSFALPSVWYSKAQALADWRTFANFFIDHLIDTLGMNPARKVGGVWPVMVYLRPHTPESASAKFNLSSISRTGGVVTATIDDSVFHFEPLASYTTVDQILGTSTVLDASPSPEPTLATINGNVVTFALAGDDVGQVATGQIVMKGLNLDPDQWEDMLAWSLEKYAAGKVAIVFFWKGGTPGYGADHPMTPITAAFLAEAAKTHRMNVDTSTAKMARAATAMTARGRR